MIGSVSNYTSYTSTNSTATQNARSQQLQKDLFAKLDSNGAISSDELSSGLTSAGSTDDSAALLKVLDSDSSGGVSSDELKAALQAGHERPDEEQTASAQTSSEALNRMIANSSKQYSLDNAAPVGKYLNVAT